MPYKDPEVRRTKDREYGQRWRERHPEWNERRKAYPSYTSRNTVPTLEAKRAYWEVQKALRSGSIVRPDTCSACERHAFIEAAHCDYARPLEISWLCRRCHRAMDAADPKGGMEPGEVFRTRLAANEETRKCQHCGFRITEHPGRRKYCSHPCYVAARWGHG